jgi:hypothetical protein
MALNVTLFKNRVFIDDPLKMRQSRWFLIQYDWHPYTKGEIRHMHKHTHTHKENEVKTIVMMMKVGIGLIQLRKNTKDCGPLSEGRKKKKEFYPGSQGKDSPGDILIFDFYVPEL